MNEEEKYHQHKHSQYYFTVATLQSSALSDRHAVDCEDVSVTVKDSNPLLLKVLALAEFNVVFGLFREAICKVCPSFEAEMNAYL